MSKLTFESVNKEIESLNLEALETSFREQSLMQADVASKICEIWSSIGSIVRLIANIPLIPASWRRALKVLITALDSLCSASKA